MKRMLILAVFIATNALSIPSAVGAEAPVDSLEAKAAGTGFIDDAVTEAVVAAATPGIELPDTYGLLFRTFLSLVAVIALIWGAVQLMKRLSPESTGGSGGGQIRVLERAYLAPKRAVYVVQIGDKALALGVTEQQVTNLAELDLEQTLSAYPKPGGSRSAAFASVFESVRARFDGKQVAN
jgi:flagellar biosynthetic protein FliO